MRFSISCVFVSNKREEKTELKMENVFKYHTVNFHLCESNFVFTYLLQWRMNNRHQNLYQSQTKTGPINQYIILYYWILFYIYIFKANGNWCWNLIFAYLITTTTGRERERNCVNYTSNVNEWQTLNPCFVIVLSSKTHFFALKFFDYLSFC